MTRLHAAVFGAVLGALALASPSAAQSQASAATAEVTATKALDEIWQLLDMTNSLSIMRDEGQAMVADLERDYLGAGHGAGWDRAVEQIYDPEVMNDLMRDAFARDFADTDPAPVVAFFSSDLGRKIVRLELSARRAFSDADTEAAARDRIRTGDVDPARQKQIEDFIDVNDLVAYNVTGALNTNFAFLSGLAEAELFRTTEAEILDNVYANAEETRVDTEEWLRAYLTMAYQPLRDDELAEYIAFSKRPEGQRLNRALFAGFGVMYDTQYNALGRAVADQLGAQDL